MTNLINAFAEKWFAWNLSMLWQVAALIVVIWMLDLAVRKWAWPQLRYALWLLILVKLVLPPSLTSPTSFTAEIPFFVEKSVKVQLTQPASPVTPPNSQPTEPQIATLQISPDYPLTPINLTPQTILETPAKITAASSPLSAKSYAFIIWLAGILVLSAWLLIRLTKLWFIII